ncbi:MAG TPA: hypothetical protein VGB37_01075 [Candidatus Lokiarchaeia archaeon]
MEEIKINDLILKGWIERGKIVRKCTPTSGAIYLHKSLIGKKYDIFFIPVEETPQVDEEVKKAEKSLKENLNELK